MPPSLQPVPREVNMFSDQQEVDLGDAMAESIANRTKVIEDEHLNAHLRQIGERLVQHLPPTNMKFRFYLIELSEANAFSIAGGRVYVSRKIVALAQNDDELAGVLAHELGHIVTHQSAIYMSRRFRELLGVTQVGNRADIFEKFHQFMENEARKPGHGVQEEEKGQYTADQVGLFAMARAGYAPHAYVDLWDRFQQTHGKTGSWFSDLFGATTPSQRRLREMLKDVAVLPPGCADIPPSSAREEFAKWQAEVVAYSDAGRQESLPGLLVKQSLTPRLRPDVSNLRFSRDGKYLLVQDEGGIHILTREPLALLFYIPALNARDASFTPDSHSIVFHNDALRVEAWSIDDRKRTAVHEMTPAERCIQTALSPDGATLACLQGKFDLVVMDVASGTVIGSKKNFYQPTFAEAISLLLASIIAPDDMNTEFIHMGFSPDARYFLAGHDSATFVYDQASRRETSLPGAIKKLLSSSFTFLDQERIVGIDQSSPGKSPILRFPSGERLDQIPLANGIKLRGPAAGDYLFVGPMKDAALGIMDLKTKRLFLSFKHEASDMYNGVLVTERINGEIALHHGDGKLPLAQLKLPEARLGPLRAAAVSPDFHWLAVSNRTRGAVWDIPHNTRVMHVRSFHGAWFDDQMLYADMPKFESTERQIARFVPSTDAGEGAFKIDDPSAAQDGRFLVVKSPKDKNSGNYSSDVTVQVRDIRDNKPIWSRYFRRELPRLFFAPGKVLLEWSLDESAGREELQHFPEIKEHADKEDYFCEVLDLAKDSPAGKLLIKTNKGSFHLLNAAVDGDWVVVSANHNQVMTYSLASGEQKGHFFGARPVSLSQAQLLAVESDADELSVYDLATSRLRQKYVFNDPISLKEFSPDGKRLLVLTVSQNLYVLDTSATNASLSNSPH